MGCISGYLVLGELNELLAEFGRTAHVGEDGGDGLEDGLGWDEGNVLLPLLDDRFVLVLHLLLKQMEFKNNLTELPKIVD